MITIKCSQCKRKIFKYNKIGKGRILRCWDTRIIEDYSIRCDNEVRCKCGNVIGIKESKSIKMKQNSFVYSGTITKK